MRTWIDRLLRRPEVSVETVSQFRRAPAPGQRPADETELASKRRLRARMSDNLPNLPMGQLRDITTNCIEALDSDIRQLEKAP